MTDLGGPVTHHIVITKSPDWHEDDPCWDGEIVCVTPETCEGWQECLEDHGGADPGECPGEHPDDRDAPRSEHVPWCDEYEFEFHGVVHTWQYGYGWTVPYQGCVVIGSDEWSDGVSEAADEIGHAHGEGTYEVDVDWWDESPVIHYAGEVA